LFAARWRRTLCPVLRQLPRNGEGITMMTTLRRAMPVMAAAALLAPAAASAAGLTGGPMMLAAARTALGPPGGPVPTGFRPQSVTFVSASEGWVLGTAPCTAKPCTAVLRTVDGGRTWQGIPAPKARLSNFVQGHGVGLLRFADPLDGFAFGPDLYVTHNGGTAWHRVRLPGTIGDLEAADGVVYAAVTSSSGRERIYRSPASSNRWSRVAGLPASRRLPAYSFPGPGTITLHGSAGWIFIAGRLYVTKTGTGWVRERVPCEQHFVPTLAAYDQRRLTLVCTGDPGAGSAEKVVYSSRDGGATFTRVGQAPLGGIIENYVAQPRPRRVLIATSSIAISIDASGNGGRTWHTALELGGAGNNDWNDFGFTTATQGVALEGMAGETNRLVPGHLYMTRNSGRSWLRVHFRAQPLTAYVTNYMSGTVTPIRVATGKAGKAISVGSFPDAVAITPDGTTAYVVNDGSGTVTPIQTATNTAGPAITVGRNPGPIAITPNGKTAYVVSTGSGTVTPIQTATNTAGPAITVGRNANDIAITPNGKTAYVEGGDQSVYPIDTATNTVGKGIKVGAFPDQIAITPNGKTAYVVNSGSSSVTPIDTATNAAGPAIKVGFGPSAIAITPDGTTAYAVNLDSNSVTPIDTATNTVGPAIAVGDGALAITITPDGTTAYVSDSDSDTVIPILTASNTASKAIKVGDGPGTIAITPDGKTAYIALEYSDTVIPILTATNSAGPAIKVGDGPSAIAITP
jgi:YVTN family beta-propeller protein